MLKRINFLENIVQRGMLLNIASFSAQAVIGISINAILFAWSGIATVGLFNVLYAVYAVAGQLVAFGLSEAILNHSRVSDSCNDQRSSILSALFCSLIVSVTFSCLIFLAIKYTFDTDKFPDIANGLILLSLALPFFSLNKVLVAFFNSYSRFSLMAALPLARALFILLCTIVLLYNDEPIASSIGYVFVIPEILIFFIFCPFLSRWVDFPGLNELFSRSTYFLKFGVKVCGYSVLTELFFRIDVITISLLFTKEHVGIYTIAALFLEGVIQVLFIFRQVSIPEFRSKLDSGSLHQISVFIKSQSLTGLFIALVLSIAVWVGYCFLLIFGYSLSDDNFLMLLGLLLTAGVVYSVVSPIENLAYLTNEPVQQTAYLLIGSVTTVLSILFLYTFGKIYFIPIGVIVGFLSSQLFWYFVIWRGFVVRIKQ